MKTKMEIKQYKNIFELYHDGELLARIIYADDTMEIYPVKTSEDLSIMVRGNGFDYDSEEQLTNTIKP